MLTLKLKIFLSLKLALVVAALFLAAVSHSDAQSSGNPLNLAWDGGSTDAGTT